jgi:oligopeptidase B
MRNILILLAAAAIAACNQSSSTMNRYKWPADVKPPLAEKEPKEFIAHGDKRIDEYYWLNQRESPKVLDYLKAENAYLDTMMSSTKDLREKLYNEMKGRIK